LADDGTKVISNLTQHQSLKVKGRVLSSLDDNDGASSARKKTKINLFDRLELNSITIACYCANHSIKGCSCSCARWQCSDFFTALRANKVWTLSCLPQIHSKSCDLITTCKIYKIIPSIALHSNARQGQQLSSADPHIWKIFITHGFSV